MHAGREVAHHHVAAQRGGGALGEGDAGAVHPQPAGDRGLAAVDRAGERAGDGELAVGAHAGAQLLEAGVHLQAHRAGFPAALAAGAQRAARGGAAGTLEEELVDHKAGVIEARAQAAAFEGDAVDHRAQAQVVGAQRAPQLRVGPRAGNREVGLERAADAPARRRKQ